MIEWIVTSSILIAVIITLRRLLKGKISLRLQYALWALVLVRLLVPLSLGNTGFSVLNILPENPAQAVLSAALSIGVPKDADTLPAGSIDTPGENAAAEAQNETPHDNEDTVTNVEAHVTNWAAIAFSVWVTGIAVVGLFLLVSNLRFAARMKKTRHVRKVGACKLLVYVTNAVDTPCLFGLFHPAIYITPEAAENATVLRHTIEHETTHFRHGDHFWAILRGICLALHWYNPLVWWAAFLSRSDSELACDEATIRRIGEKERAEYGRTLIGMTCQKRTALLITATTMTTSKSSIKERIVLIARKPKMAVYTLIAVLLVASIAVGCTFTGAKKDENAPTESTIQVASQVSAPDAVLNYAKDYVKQEIESYTQCGANPPDGCEEYQITGSKITGLTQIDTGTAGLDSSINMYRLEYRLRPDHPDNVVLAGGMKIEDGWITEWGSTGQPYLLLFCDDSGTQPVWVRICVTNTDVITQDYGTPEMLAQYGSAYTAAAMELYQKYSEEATAALTDLFTTLTSEQTPVRLTLTIVTAGENMVVGGHDGWGCNNDVYLTNALSAYAYEAVSAKEMPTQGQKITLYPTAAGENWSVDFYEGSDYLRLEAGGETTYYSAAPEEGELGQPSIGTILRMWFDEAEWRDIGGSYETQGQIVIPDQGQGYLAAAKEYCEAFEGKHLIATTGSEFCYTYVSCQAEAAQEATAHFRETGEIDPNTYAFYVVTAFVPENERARDWSMAGNTGAYTGTDPSVPQGAYEYSRCGYITLSEDGWHGILVGTGW